MSNVFTVNAFLENTFHLNNISFQSYITVSSEILKKIWHKTWPWTESLCFSRNIYLFIGYQLRSFCINWSHWISIKIIWQQLTSLSRHIWRHLTTTEVIVHEICPNLVQSLDHQFIALCFFCIGSSSLTA